MQWRRVSHSFLIAAPQIHSVCPDDILVCGVVTGMTCSLHTGSNKLKFKKEIQNLPKTAARKCPIDRKLGSLIAKLAAKKRALGAIRGRLSAKLLSAALNLSETNFKLKFQGRTKGSELIRKLGLSWKMEIMKLRETLHSWMKPTKQTEPG